MIKKELENIENQLNEMEKYIALSDTLAINISSWSVGDHLEHLFRAHLVILERIEARMHRPPEMGKRLSIFARLILLLGFIPRNVGKAPNLAGPKGSTESELRGFYARFRSLIERLKNREKELEESPYAFPHPSLGVFTVKQWLRFIDVHTRHHLKIIKSIKAQ